MSAFGNSPLTLGGNALSVPSGSTPVGGPGTSTDNAVARWDGTSGNLLQNSALTISDAASNNVTVTPITNTALTFTTLDNNRNIELDPHGTGLVRFVATGLGTTSTSLVRVANDTAATGGATVQISPRLAWRGNAWDTSASQTVDFFIENLPASAATPTGILKFGYSLNGAAATYPMTLTSAGALTTLGSITGTTLFAGAGNSLSFTGRAKLNSPSDGILALQNDAGNDFTRLQLGGTTSSFPAIKRNATALNFRLADDSADAPVTAAAGTFSGTVQAGVPGSAALSLGGAAAAVTTATKLTKTVGSIGDAAATAVLTVTIPNAAHSASLKVRLAGSLGAGGAIGANEATGTVSYDFAIARTAGVNAVTTISSAYGSAMANVAGAATITVTAAASAIAGAVGDPNTFTVNVTITRGSGSSTNHTCFVLAEICNANASGISIA